MSYAPPRPQRVQPFTRSEEALAFLGRLETSMDSLMDMIEQETVLVRTGKLLAAAELGKQKNNCAQDYTLLATTAKAQEKALRNFVPRQLEAVLVKHAAFQKSLKLNMSALGSARDVTKGMIEMVADVKGKGKAPKTYGQYGTITTQTLGRAEGLSVDKAL